jgi:N-acetylated-alpha-linked acidic dipeptidase
VYDTYTHFERNGDPGFAYTAALTEVAGRATLRLADADVLPFQFEPLASKIGAYLDEIKENAEHMRTETNRTNDLIGDDIFSLTADPSKVSLPPEVKESVPHLNFAPLENAIQRLEDAARDYDGHLREWLVHPGEQSVDALNEMLIRVEQDLLLEDGLPRRAWFRHSIYAPGFYTGYGVKTIPGVREAVEERSWPEVEAQVVLVTAALDRVTASIQRAIKILSDG